MKFGALIEIILGQTTYGFKAQQSSSSNNSWIGTKIRKICMFEANCAKRNVEFKIDRLSSNWFLAIWNSLECKDQLGNGLVRIPLPILSKRSILQTRKHDELHGQWISSKWTENFEVTPLISNLACLVTYKFKIDFGLILLSNSESASQFLSSKTHKNVFWIPSSNLQCILDI